MSVSHCYLYRQPAPHFTQSLSFVLALLLVITEWTGAKGAEGALKTTPGEITVSQRRVGNMSTAANDRLRDTIHTIHMIRICGFIDGENIGTAFKCRPQKVRHWSNSNAPAFICAKTPCWGLIMNSPNNNETHHRDYSYKQEYEKVLHSGNVSFNFV